MSIIYIAAKNKESVIKLIKEERWKEASSYGDKISIMGAKNNNQEWWDQINNVKSVGSTWNSCSYGNVAMAIYYGSDFPDRKEETERLKKILLNSC